MAQKKYFLIVSLFFLSFIVVPSLYAKISVDPSFTGTLLITYPSGEVVLIEPGDPIPDIPSNSILQIFHGQFTVTTEKGDKVQLSCLNHTASVGGGSSAQLSCGDVSENEGVLKALSGAIEIVDAAGQKSTLNEGMDFPIHVTTVQEETPPTAAPETFGGEPLGDSLGSSSPVDSRGIESSPSQ